ncbi:uncharacterized protein LOC125498526 [Beta vulgaris subsp. vulgaris]|uniref:uncharacterized protein LOC125498526 n=1 Tax=Beta vulgaris subsp. vulgaris TaxID=3555 RepID=UPI002037524F|nr:uncharacterized protein LOC125498526 [Beta vulgaris subsp. vulgaris]
MICTEFLRHKAKLEWIRHGDENSSLCHQNSKARRIQNQVYVIYDKDGIWQDREEGVTQAFLDFYQGLLGSTSPNRRLVVQQIVQSGPLLTKAHKAILNSSYTVAEIKASLKSIDGAKALGLDGFRAYFYKDSWSIVEEDVIHVVLDFFTSGKLLKEVNSTSITLIPKNKCPTHVTLVTLDQSLAVMFCTSVSQKS